MFLINSIYSFILLPILTVIAIQSINTHFYKKIYLHTNFFFANLLLTVLSITFFSNLIQIILFFDKNFFYTNLNIIKQILLILLILNFLYFFSYFKKNLKDISINQNSLLIEKKIIIYLSIVFFSSIGLVTDADSLIYNSKVSRIILNGFPISYFIDNIHISLFGIIEIFNVYQEILGTSNVNRILNIFCIINFIFFIKTFSKNLKNSNFFILSILSIPVFAIILNHEKTFLLPLFAQFSIFVFVFFKNKINETEKFLIISAIISTSFFKLSFILSGLVIFIFVIYKFYKQTKILRIFAITILCFVIFGLPHFIFKFYHFGNPFNPFLNNIFSSIFNENINQNFANYLRQWSNSGSLIYPLNLFLPGTLSKIHNILGIGFFVILLLKFKKNRQNIELLAISVVSLVLTIIFSQNSPRFYVFSLMLFSCFILINDLNFRKLLSKIILIQFIFTTSIISLMIPITISTSWLGEYSEEYRNKFIFRYEINQKINKLIGKNKFIIIDIPNYYSQNYDISIMTTILANNNDDIKNFKKFLNSNQVEYLITNNFEIQKMKFINKKERKIDNFLKKCFNKSKIKTFEIEVANRKKLIFDNNKINLFYVYKKNKDCIF